MKCARQCHEVSSNGPKVARGAREVDTDTQEVRADGREVSPDNPIPSGSVEIACADSQKVIMTLIASRSFITRYPSGTPSRFVIRSSTRPGWILPSRCGSAGDGDVGEERGYGRRHVLVLRHADASGPDQAITLRGDVHGDHRGSAGTASRAATGPRGVSVEARGSAPPGFRSALVRRRAGASQHTLPQTARPRSRPYRTVSPCGDPRRL